MFVMSVNNDSESAVISSAAVRESGLKETDLDEFFLSYDSEFNKEDLHDRVLIFDVLKEGRQLTDNVVLRTEPKLKDKLEPSDITEIHSLLPSDLCSDVEEEKGVSEPNAHVNVSDRKRPAQQQHLTNSKKSRSESNTDKSNPNINLGETSCSNYGNSEIFSSELNLFDSMAECEIIREHKIFVHSTFLAMHSHYFRALFYSGMRESTSKEVHVKIHESEEQSHLKMLEAIYRPYVLDNLSLEKLLQILELANKYDLTYVFRKCKYVLLKTELCVDDCEKIMKCIEIKQKMPHTSDLAAYVSEFLSCKFSPLDKTWESEKFVNLSETLLRNLLSSEHGGEQLLAKSENTVFHALMYWIIQNGYNYHSIPNNSDPPSLLKLVKFELLTIDYLYHVVQDHHIAKEMPAFSELYLKGITYHALPTDMKETIAARKKIDKLLPDFTWVVTKEKIESIIEPSLNEEMVNENESSLDANSVLESPRFWWCGYEMQMKISHITNTTSGQLLLGKVHLHVHGLQERSKLPVEWIIASTGFHPVRASKLCTTFSFNINTSSQNVKILNHLENGGYAISESITIAICISPST